MERKTYIHLFVSVVFLCFCSAELEAKKRLTASILLFQQTQVQQDTLKKDTIPPYEPSKKSTYEPSYRFGDPFSNRMSPTPLQLADPSSIDLEVEYDSSINYSVYERIGDVNFRPVTTMSFEEYDRYNDQQIQKEYFKQKSAGLDGESAVSGRSLIPRLYISPVFDRLFGGSYVDIQPNGYVNLDFGGRFQRVDNPSISRRQQRNGGFNFNQQISLNLVGKIGEKLQVTANFDNNNTFDFQNNMKVEYTGYDEDIVKKIEIGNVSMPLKNRLITDANSLFGVKTQLQFGKLFVTGVISRQQSTNESITISTGQTISGSSTNAGSSTAPGFSVRASEYDDNRHFFLGHFFRDNYEYWHRNLPLVQSGITITRIEVYVSNQSNDTKSTREVLALMDLGEGDPEHIYGQPQITASSGQQARNPTNNQANNLFTDLVRIGGYRDASQISNTLSSQFGFENTVDFERISPARKLESSEYTLNQQLGYITLLQPLNSNAVLSVAYEYTYNGRVYKVGELTSDYAGVKDNEVIVMKMLKPSKINVEVPTWDLMMKNIYPISNGRSVSQSGFQLRIQYRDDASGIDNPSLHEGERTRNIPLIELLGLDQLNQNNDKSKDGNFDFVDGVTIDASRGNVIFPVLEPFGATLEGYFNDNETSLKQKYVYDELYSETQVDARLLNRLNKFYLIGDYQGATGAGGSSATYSLNAISLVENSVVVTAGGTLLTEGLDYRIDYNLGTLTIIKEEWLNSGKDIQISYEQDDLFNFQTKWFYGTRLDYVVNDNFNIGATLLHLNERPGGRTRYTIGDEPTKNTKYGFDLTYQDEVPLLTKMMDVLPLVSTKAPSTISFSGEYAQLIPGTSNLVNGEGTSYIDDFETAAIPINLSGAIGWKLGTTPETEDDRFDMTSSAGPLGFNYRKAKIAWYSIDPSVFYQPGQRRPSNITDDDLSNHYVRPVIPQEIYPQRSRNVYIVPETIFDVAYYPNERGQYNYNPNLSAETTESGEVVPVLNEPEKNYGAIYRNISSETNFTINNVEYLEFWMLDPFINSEEGRVLDGLYNNPNTTGGQLIFNIGEVSEDFNGDGNRTFESGFPNDGDLSKKIQTDWGFIPSESYLSNNFQATGRANQDIGFDGLSNDDEVQFFADQLPMNQIPSLREDPSADNFKYFLDEDYDASDAKILERYKNFNGLDGNSPNQSGNNVQSYTILPDNEDSNTDGNFVTTENYNEYKINLRPNQLEVGSNFIIDRIRNDENDPYWYLIRIPIKTAGTPINGGMDLNTVRSIRMYLTGWRQPVVLRMSQLQLVGSQWRKYTETLKEEGLNEVPETSTSDFSVSVVNIEENSGGSGKIPYTIPPGINRDRDNTTIINRQLNEQSLQVCVDDLPDKDARAVYRQYTVNLVNYGRLKMFFHAHANGESSIADDEVSAFLRIGTDETENYYEIEVPLKITTEGSVTAESIWPEENEIDLALDELLALKASRNRAGVSTLTRFSGISENGRYNLIVRGDPDMSSLQTLMIGVRNPSSDDGAPKSVCLWANELRVTDFDKHKGWAANASVVAQLADVARISATGQYTSFGFGEINENLQQREQWDKRSYDLTANVNLDKFLLPEKTGLRVPMMVSMENTREVPHYDPLDPDVPLEASLSGFETQEERDAYRKIVENRVERRSINFTNVHKEKVNKEANTHFFDVENLSFSYSHSETVSSNVSTETALQKQVTGGVAYNYSPNQVVLEPFAKSEAFKSPYLKLIKDMNLTLSPSSVSIRGDLARNFRMTRYYDNDLQPQYGNEFYERLFTFTRNYAFRWNVFKSLNIDYSARANAVIDEIEAENGPTADNPIEGDLDTREEMQYIWGQIKNLGRMKNFNQNISAIYKLPFDKLPLTDWISGDIRYSASYTWTAGSLGQLDEEGNFFGHTIENSRDRGVMGKLDMVKLYNKVSFLKEVNQPQRKRPKKDDDTPQSPNLAKAFLRLMMSLRSVNITYNIRETTSLAGFMEQPFLLGMDSSWSAPGWKFLLGDQDADVRRRAAANGWITRSMDLTTPFVQTASNNLTVKAALEPSSDFKVTLDAQRTINSSFQEIFRYDTTDGYSGYKSLTPSRNGSYNASFITIKTAFEKSINGNESEAFNSFVRNIDLVQNRQNATVTGDGYFDTLSQDVLIPAFIAAYTGESALDVSLNPFPRIPLPGWRIDYNGLTKIPALAEVFSAVTLSHGYRSAYSVNDYSFNISEYANDPNNAFDVSLTNSILDYPRGFIADDSSKLVPVYVISQVSIAEQFAPLIGINVRTKNNITTRAEYKQSRALSLNMSNAQVTETTSNDLTLDFSMTKDKFKLPIRIQGRTISFENALTMRVSLTVRDAETIQRRVSADDVTTTGSTSFQLRPSMTYKLNKSLDLTMYFDRNVNEPKVNGFKTATTSFGTQLRFSLAQ